MYNSGSYYRQQPGQNEQWVPSKDKPGLLEHPTGWYYYEKSGMYAFYDQDAKEWKMYDKSKDQWYVYNGNVFFCESLAVNGTCTTVAPVPTTVEEEEFVYIQLTYLLELQSL